MPITKAKDSRKSLSFETLLLNSLEFCDGFEVFGAARGALHFNQSV